MSYNQVRINPVDSADTSEIENNIEKNLDLIKTWVDYKPGFIDTSLTGVLLGGGPSLEANLKCGFIHKDTFPSDTHMVFTVKHALPLLMEYGFDNLNCVVLDPRPIDGESTHGVMRNVLYGAAKPESVVFYVASMTHPSVTEYLLAHNFTVVGWMATTQALKRFQEQVKVSIGGGTCSIMRAFGLGRECFGIRRYLCLGIDASLETPSKEILDNPNSYWYTDKDPVSGSPKRLQMFYGQGESLSSNRYLPLWSTGELGALLQDQEALYSQREQLGLEIHVLGTDKGRSLTGQIADAFGV
jgi:hypothetical protein